MLRRIARDVPGIVEVLLVVVSDDGAGRVGVVSENLLQPVVLSVGKVPTQHEWHRLHFPGLEANDPTERAHVGTVFGTRIGFGLEPAVFREVVPEKALGIEPLTAIPPVRVGDVGVNGGEGERAEVGMIGGHVARRHMETAEGAGIDEAVQVPPECVHARHVLERAHDGRIDHRVAFVFEMPVENGDRNAGVLVVSGDEGIEALERHGEGHARIGQLETCERVRSEKPTLAKPRHSRKTATGNPKGPSVGGRELRFQDHGPGFTAWFAAPECEKRVVEIVALVGTVFDLPIPKIAAPPERYRTGADASEWKRDLGEKRLFEYAPHIRWCGAGGTSL